ncbi:MAG: CDGSH iron-sulfur domain-containing protein [Casimicrobiaceae bacterium]
MSERPRIECTPNGPYRVSELENFEYGQGHHIDTKPVMMLCRCGGSGSKPFCDGTHKRNGFSGERLGETGTDRRESYQAARITIHDNRAICAHSGLCTDRLASVFKYGSEPWIDPAVATVEAIVAAVDGCPSGALSYSLDGVEGVDRPRDPSITVTTDGPYAVVGGVLLSGQAWAQGASTEHYTLCRCGASRHKPFCDGTHWSIGFKG